LTVLHQFLLKSLYKNKIIFWRVFVILNRIFANFYYTLCLSGDNVAVDYAQGRAYDVALSSIENGGFIYVDTPK